MVTLPFCKMPALGMIKVTRAPFLLPPGLSTNMIPRTFILPLTHHMSHHGHEDACGQGCGDDHRQSQQGRDGTKGGYNPGGRGSVSTTIGFPGSNSTTLLQKGMHVLCMTIENVVNLQ